MKFCVFSSGSSGNSSFAAAGGANLLIDAGISKKKIEESLSKIHISLDKLQGILITHEHSDHIKGLLALSSSVSCPIYATKDTIRGICHAFPVHSFGENAFHEIEKDVPFAAGGAKITAFSVSHDGEDPVGFTIEEGTKKLAYVTDLGTYGESVVKAVTGAQVVYVEANYNQDLLLHGPYPASLKRRVKGRKGHLSNEETASLLAEAWTERLQKVYLGHLSNVNNRPDIAVKEVREKWLEAMPLFAGYIEKTPIEAAPRYTMSSLIEW